MTDTAKLRSALEPFADLANYIDAEQPQHAGPHHEVQIETWPYTLSVGWLYAARQALSELDSEGEAARPDIVRNVIELARHDIARTQTDFLGRMEQALGTYVGIFDNYPDGELPPFEREEAKEEIAGLAGLALAQLAMIASPKDPFAALTTTQGEGS